MLFRGITLLNFEDIRESVNLGISIHILVNQFVLVIEF